jgi:hypothetical protein
MSQSAVLNAETVAKRCAALLSFQQSGNQFGMISSLVCLLNALEKLKLFP